MDHGKYLGGGVINFISFMKEKKRDVLPLVLPVVCALKSLKSPPYNSPSYFLASNKFVGRVCILLTSRGKFKRT